MNLNMKQQTLQYNTIPDGGDDGVVLEHPQEKSTGRSYSVLGGLVLLLVAAVVVLHQGGGGHDDHQHPASDPAGSILEEGVHGTPPPPCFGQICGSGCCGDRCCVDEGVDDGTPPTLSADDGLVLASLTTLRNEAEKKFCVEGPCPE